MGNLMMITKGRTMKRVTKTSLTPMAIIVGVAAVGAIVAVAQNNKRIAAGSAVQANSDRRPIVVAQNMEKTPERKPLTYYTGGVRGDLFAAPQQAAPQAKKKAEPAKPPAPPPAPPAVVNPFAEYVYTGTMESNGQQIALVENTKTREGQFLKVGDPFVGGTVAQISQRTVTINVAGSNQFLSKTDDFKLTPLDK